MPSLSDEDEDEDEDDSEQEEFKQEEENDGSSKSADISQESDIQSDDDEGSGKQMGTVQSSKKHDEKQPLLQNNGSAYGDNMPKSAQFGAPIIDQPNIQDIRRDFDAGSDDDVPNNQLQVNKNGQKLNSRAHTIRKSR